MIPQCHAGRRSTQLLLAFAAILLLAISSAQAGENPIRRVFLKGPYLQAPSATSMTIMWESPTNRPGVVYYGLGRFDRLARSEEPHALLVVTNWSITNLTTKGKTHVTKLSRTNRVFLYEISLPNLRPNSVYSYSAETDGVRTPPKRFKTFGAHPYKMTFIAYGDTRTNPKTHAALTANFKRYSPDFILHLGDLVAEGKKYELWSKEFFDPLASVIDEVPILPAIGNHEEDGTNYLRYLHLPGKERWYSYDVGPVHVLSLDYHYEKSSDEQFAFARNDLLSASAPWKVVMLHYPVFNIGGHGTGWGHTNYLPLFHQAKVDLVIAGHSHLYERFRPIAMAKGLEAWPITHITTGGGGAPLATLYSHPALAAFSRTNHFVLIEATPTSLRGRAISTNNTVIDSFELKKYGGRPPAYYYVQVYPEDVLKLSFEIPNSLTGTASAVPKTNAPALVTFNLRPLKNHSRPLELEVNLAPNSTPYYELEGGPFRVITPFGNETNRTAKVHIRATGKKKVVTEGKEKNLSPALVFQARTVAGKTPTMAYGYNCRVKVPSVSSNAVAAAQR